METADLYRLIDDPSLLSADTLAPLERIAARFPYFQTVRLLYLKNLALLHDPRLEAEVERTAALLADRRKLFFCLEGERYGLSPLPVGKEQAPEEPDSFSLIDAFLSNCPGEKEGKGSGAVWLQPSVSSDYLYWSLSSAGNKVETGHHASAGHHVSTGKNKEENAEGEALERAGEPGQSPVSSAGELPASGMESAFGTGGKGMDLIDNFLREEEENGPVSRLARVPKEEPSETDRPQKGPQDAHLKSLDDSYFTETLARIYVKQRRYEKALQIIKNLSLKYPEKNVYFADQIRFLEKLIINTKK